MNGFCVKNGRALVGAAALLAIATWVPRAEAYPSYDDGAGHGCVECHNSSSEDGGFTGGNAGGLHILHVTTFGITSCALCHSSSAGGSKPVLTYYSGDGYGCAGCHGRVQGETSIHSGKPKSSGYGLRKVHAAAGETICATCHFPGSSITGDPSPAPTIVAETVQPPYYLLSNNNLTDPCSAAQEGFEGTVGLDNDGNGSRDANDPACKARTTTPGPKPTATATPTPGKPKKNIKVKPGESIQAAVDAVAEGGTVSVLPGTYEEMHDGTAAVRITKNGIKLIGKSTKTKKVILVPHAGQDNGIVVEPAVDGQRINGVKIQGFTVQGFPHNGIFTRYVDNFTIQKNESIDNLENGIWPTLSANGLVKNNVAYGSLDSALWVEGVENVRILNNNLYNSPTGLEITVSKRNHRAEERCP
jgi:parallel beta-helix repeat protein